MSLIVEYREWGEPINLPEVAPAVPNMELVIERWRPESDDELGLMLVAKGRNFDALETALEDVENVVSVDMVADDSAARVYWVTIVSRIYELSDFTLIDGAISHVRIESDGIYVTGYLADREELFKIREFLTDLGLNMEVTRLEEVSGESRDSFLTEQQFEALFTAYEMGYFDVPKEATQAEVADRLDISPPALSERLKRGQQRLVHHHMHERRELNDLS